MEVTVNPISQNFSTARPRPAPEGMKPLFQKEETPTAQDSVFFRRGDDVQSNDWSCHLDRFRGIRDKSDPDYMPRSEGYLAATAALGAGVATSLLSTPYSLSVAGPLIVGCALWGTGHSQSGLISTIGQQLTLPVVGASQVADTVFEKVAGSFYEGNGATLTLHQDQNGKVWGIPNRSQLQGS